MKKHKVGKKGHEENGICLDKAEELQSKALVDLHLEGLARKN